MTTRAPARPRRSALYTPAANNKVLEKAVASQADVLIFDLEDAVASEAKSGARETVCTFLSKFTSRRKEIVVRVNGLEMPWCHDDVMAVSRLGISAVLFPKVSTKEDVRSATSLLTKSGANDSVALWCMIETPLAILNAHSIAATLADESSRMNVWVLGTNDLSKELGARNSTLREPLVPAMAVSLLAARAYGICLLDGVHNDIKDTVGFTAACDQGVAMGFDGKTLIHPSQIDACNRAYSPSCNDVARAQEIVEAFRRPENGGKAVLQIGGKMVELLHLKVAERTLEIAQAIARINGHEQPAQSMSVR